MQVLKSTATACVLLAFPALPGAAPAAYPERPIRAAFAKSESAKGSDLVRNSGAKLD